MHAQLTYVVVGAGVVGMSTALELKARRPDSRIVVIAKHLPGDSAADYASAWAGANWFSAATDNGRQEGWDAVTYTRFRKLAQDYPECGIVPMKLQCTFDQPIEECALTSAHTGKIWYDELVGGLRYTDRKDLPPGSCFGFEFDSFVIDVQRYLPWLACLVSHLRLQTLTLAQASG